MTFQPRERNNFQKDGAVDESPEVQKWGSEGVRRDTEIDFHLKWLLLVC